MTGKFCQLNELARTFVFICNASSHGTHAHFKCNRMPLWRGRRRGCGQISLCKSPSKWRIGQWMNEWMASQACAKLSKTEANAWSRVQVTSRSMSAKMLDANLPWRGYWWQGGGRKVAGGICWQVKNFRICDNFKFIKDMQSCIKVSVRVGNQKVTNERT